MGAYYDTYDYTSYWNEREYEHESEVISLKSLLNQIPEVSKALEIGGGFGRLVPHFSYRAKSVTLTEPSAKLLSLAKDRLSNLNNVVFVQSTLENLIKKFRKNSFDLVVMIRVMHHLPNHKQVFATINSLTAPNGYLIIEFANKIHFKAAASQVLKGNFKYITNPETLDIRSEKSKKQKTIAFVNYHPIVITKGLEEAGFKVLDIRSVSNIRSPFVKKYIPKSVLLGLEKLLQKPLSYIYFGPSIFILAQKRG